jgi:HPt (histidine-containing phosphotransfer) domain-containing protein
MPNTKNFDLGLLIESVGDGEDLTRMLTIFVESTPKILKELNDFYFDHNFNGIADSAHRLKATIDMLRIKELQKVVREMDKLAAVQENQHKLPQMINQTNLVMNKVLSEIQMTYLPEKQV